MKNLINHRGGRVLLIALSVVSALVVSTVPVLAGDGDVLRTTPVVNTDHILNLAGSSTVYPFIDALEEPFEALHTGWDVQTVLSSSGAGKDALNALLVDIANASSPQSSTTYTFVDHIVARDAVCIIVNVDCPLTNITREQLANIYQGDYTNWSDLNWPEGGAIQPIARVTTSGTRAAFIDLLKNYGSTVGPDTSNLTESDELTTIGTATRMPENADMVAAVGDTSNAIGYCGVGYLGTDDDIKALTLEGQAPTVDNIIGKTYTGWRYLHMYTILPSEIPNHYDPMSEIFISFVLDDAGQYAVETEGFVSYLPYWDPNGDYECNISDVGFIGLKWGATGADGWCREDINSDGTINISDVGTLGLHWNESWVF